MTEVIEQDLDFSRYAPEPRRSYAAPAIQDVGELGQLSKMIRTSFGIAFAGIFLALAIIRHRIWHWFDTHILHSFAAAWPIAGLGWGAFFGLIFFHSYL